MEGIDAAAIYWAPVAAQGNAALSQNKVLNGTVTTITVSQTQNAVITPLLTLVNDSAIGSNWTLRTTSTAADALLRPTGQNASGIGQDTLVNVEFVNIYLQTATTIITTGGVTVTAPYEIELVGMIG
jgi:hypothetical protein